MTFPARAQSRIGQRPAAYQRGFSLVSAIFLLVVLAVLGVAIVSISTTQHTSSALDLQGARAYQAARAGIEWGVFQQTGGGPCFAQSSFVPPAPTLSAFTVTVSCTSPAPDPNAPAVTSYEIVSTACTQPDAATNNCPGTAGGTYYVERQLRVKLER